VTLLAEFGSAGFGDARIVRRCRNPRSPSRDVLVAEVVATRDR